MHWHERFEGEEAMAKFSRWVLPAIALLALLVPVLAIGQPSTRVARVGWVVYSPDPTATARASALEGFRAGMRELGWTEGRNLVLDLRVADRSEAARIAQAFVASRTDVIFADGAMVNGLKANAGDTPIVFTMSGDPIEAKWVATFARPGGNVTGLSSLHLELEAKRLELLKEIKPGLRRVAVFGNSAHPGYRSQLMAAQAAARQLGMTVQTVPVQAMGDFEAAFAAIAKEDAEAIVVFSDTLVNTPAATRAIAEFAKRRRIPSISAWPSFVEAGNLMSYGPNERGFFQSAAASVDKILRGTHPSNVPVELPKGFELTVNRGTAKALGLAIPQSILVRARVIE